MGFYFSRVFKNCITGKYEEILVNTFQFVKYRVILQQTMIFQIWMINMVALTLTRNVPNIVIYFHYIYIY
jgi:hypothetical protein